MDIVQIFFEYSSDGSRIACVSAIGVLEKFIGKSFNEVKKELEENNIQRLIYDKWMDLVNEHYKNINPIVFNTQYIKYSTTLVTTLITNEFRLYLKIGDGDVVTKSKDSYKKILETKNKEVVDSLGRFEAYKNFIYYIEKNDESNKLDYIILFTDGYGNSFINEKILFQSLGKTINQYNKSVFSRWMLYKNYKGDLSKLSKAVSKDDISIIYIFINE
ncbi:protein phosphatase 2C domain-containing protein [[Clostridium] dakarense]|uniref:protein phosphatase 2C domain-containing protein n=1 Tax=Faecalimicrobium dakarense TaxID=1301100 RepID=UPI0004B316D6|nr:protein phosphatase 2C domain-containing protein [[Clostridium] dakarense]